MQGSFCLSGEFFWVDFETLSSGMIFSLVLPLLNNISMIQLYMHNGLRALYGQHGKRTSSYKLLHITSVSEWPGEGCCWKG